MKTLNSRTFTARYFLIFSPIFLLLIANSFVSGTLEPIRIFFIFAVFGVAGEILMSILWNTLYERPFWVYTRGSFFRGYSSYLNFFAWGVGGYIYYLIGEYFGFPINQNSASGFFISFFIVLSILLVLFRLVRRNKGKFEFVTIGNYIFTLIPVLATFVFVVYQEGLLAVWVILIFGLVGTLTEYLYGKVCERILGERLWIYLHKSMDSGHFTPLAIPFFAFTGLYFSLIASILL